MTNTWTQVPAASGAFNPVAQTTGTLPTAAVIPTIAAATKAGNTLVVELVNGVPTVCQVANSNYSLGVNDRLPDAVAPPVSTAYPLGTWLLNSAGAVGGVWGWSLASSGWSQLGAIGATVVNAPNAYTVAILAPLAGAAISGVTTVAVQCGTGMTNVAVRDSLGNLLAQGALVNSSISLTFASSVLPVGTQNIVVTAYDAGPGTNGLYSAATHTAVATVSVTVSSTPVVAPPNPVFFIPTASTSLNIWFDVTDGTTTTIVAGNVSALNDKTSGGHNAVQATAGNRPPLISTGLAGKPTLRFSGTGALALTVPHASAIDNIWTGGATLFLVVNPAGGGGSGFGTIVDKGTWGVAVTGNQQLFFNVKWGGTNFNWQIALSPQWTMGIPCVVEIDYDSGAFGNVPTIRVNGVTQALVNANPPLSGTMDTDAASDLTIGNSGAGTACYQGDFSGMFYCPTTVSATDRTNLRAYDVAEFALSGTSTFDPNNPTASGMTLSFFDEFTSLSSSADGIANGTKWTDHLWYQASAPSFLSVASSILSIDTGGNMASVNAAGQGYQQKFGYFEASIKFPSKSGLWPSFWLINNHRVATNNPLEAAVEIDIMEGQTAHEEGYFATSHSDSAHAGDQSNANNFVTTGGNNSGAFHRYGMLWSPTSTTIDWYYDGVKVLSVPKWSDTDSFPMMILLGNATGDILGGGNPFTGAGTTISQVDWVHVYQFPGF